MTLIHGRDILAQDVEQVVSLQFTPARFVSICNALIWALAAQNGNSLPLFTERVNVPDAGIDAEWEIELQDKVNCSTPLLESGWNVYQSKMRDILARDRDKIVAGLTAKLSGAIKALYDRKQHRPRRYVLFTNIDLSTEQHTALKAKILEGYDQPDQVHVEIVGAAELAAMLNSVPYLRSAYFVSSLFSTWEKYYEQHLREKRPSAVTELIGRERELLELETGLNDPYTRAIVLSGPHEIGKTRLALELTHARVNETVVSLDPESMTVNDLLALATPRREVVVLIDDPSLEKADRFIRQVIGRTDLKLVLTLPTAELAHLPNWGLDERIKVVSLGSLSESQSEALLRGAGADLDYGSTTWVVEQAGGNPGILIAATRLGRDLRKGAVNFAENIAKAFETKTRREIGDRAVDVLQLLSILSSVGVRGRVSGEATSISEQFGNGIDVNAILNELPRLENAGLVRVRGSFVEVIPPSFGNGLAASAFRGRLAELRTFYSSLDRSARLRLLDRLQAIRTADVNQFWNGLFGSNGPLHTLESALHNAALLTATARAVPESTAKLIEEGLAQKTALERREIPSRRELISALEELLYRRQTSASALRSLALLAEVETENYRNNATGIFSDCFIPGHPQLPLSLSARVSVLEWVLAPGQTVDLHLLGVEAIKVGLSVHLPIQLHRSRGPLPLDETPQMTWGEVWAYREQLVNALMTLVQSDVIRVRQAATTILPDSLASYTILARPADGISRLQQVVEWVL